MTERLILDCDPGHDDALAMILAAGDPRVELLAVTTHAFDRAPLTGAVRPDAPRPPGPPGRRTRSGRNPP